MITERRRMAGHNVTDAENQNSSPSYLLRSRWIQKTRSTKKNWLNTIKRDLHDMKLTWQKAQKFAEDKSK